VTIERESGAQSDALIASSSPLRPIDAAGKDEDSEGELKGRARSSKSRRSPRAATGAGAEELRRRVYGGASLTGFGLRDRIIIRAADIFFFLLISLICSTLRWEVRGRHHLDSIFASGHRAIFTFWHMCIFSATSFWRKRGIVVMSSRSRDAEYTARFIKRFGYGTARGSATRGGSRALAEMAECLKCGMDVAFTIDGPRGPAYVAKPGAVTLARHTGQAILPFHIAARRYVELPSWDRLQIPLPFTRALTLVAEPIYVSRDATPDEVAAKQIELQSSLDHLRSEAEAWLAG
jgi:lysophospholipid acyltransferase (LPLAT)-like uncharacterized protein